MVINSLMLSRKTSIKGAIPITIKLLICAGVSCFGARIIYSVRQSAISLLFAIAFAAVLYGVLVILCRLITREEL